MNGAVMEECEVIEDDPLRDEKLNKEGRYDAPDTEQYYQEMEPEEIAEVMQHYKKEHEKKTNTKTQNEEKEEEAEKEVVEAEAVETQATIEKGIFTMDNSTLGTKD